MATARELIPDGASLEELRSLAAGCEACGLYRNATQTVFGEGSAGATVMLVGEHPGWPVPVNELAPLARHPEARAQ